MVFSVSMSEISLNTKAFMAFIPSFHTIWGTDAYAPEFRLRKISSEASAVCPLFLFFIYLILTKWAGQPGRNTCICLFIEEWMESQRWIWLQSNLTPG